MKLIKNAKLEKKVVNILFEEKILKISESPISEESCSEVFDAKGFLVLPGCLDAHVHFNDPGFTHKEDFFTGTSAAAAGGVTTIIDMPCTSLPPVTTTQALKTKLDVIEPKAIVDFALWGGIRGNNISEDEINNLHNAGVAGFKMYAVSGMETFKALNYQKIASILKDFDGSDILFGFHAEDRGVIQEALAKIPKKDLKRWQSYVPSRPKKAEIVAVEQILDRMSKNRVHFVHISTAGATQRILAAKKAGKDVTLETCPHYLAFCQDDYAQLLGKLKTAPTVKYKEDKDFLSKTLTDGFIDFVATDHAGCNYQKEKALEDFSKVYCGIPGIETMVLYIIDEFFLKGKISYKRLSQILSENQAKRFRLYPQKGAIQIGSDADFTIVNLQKHHIFDETKLNCMGKYSPFDGKKFHCQIERTIVRGRSVFTNSEGLKIDGGYGRFVRRQT